MRRAGQRALPAAAGPDRHAGRRHRARVRRVQVGAVAAAADVPHAGCGRARPARAAGPRLGGIPADGGASGFATPRWRAGQCHRVPTARCKCGCIAAAAGAHRGRAMRYGAGPRIETARAGFPVPADSCAALQGPRCLTRPLTYLEGDMFEDASQAVFLMSGVGYAAYALHIAMSQPRARAGAQGRAARSWRAARARRRRRPPWRRAPRRPRRTAPRSPWAPVRARRFPIRQHANRAARPPAGAPAAGAARASAHAKSRARRGRDAGAARGAQRLAAGGTR